MLRIGRVSVATHRGLLEPAGVRRSLVRQDQTLGAIKHPLYPPGGTTSVLALAKHCHKWPHFWLLLASSHRFSYTEVTEGSVGQVPGAEVASGQGVHF